MFQPHLEILPPAQRDLWPDLAEVPPHFVLYGGTALALRMRHRVSVDFDFFSNQTIVPVELLTTLTFLKNARVLQNADNSLTVAVDRAAMVKVSFFGGLGFGRVGEPEISSDGVLEVASMLDLAGTKAAVVTQRAEAKDYIDLLALIDNGLSLSQAMGAASALYAERYNPLLTLKALTFFGDGDLRRLSQQQKEQLTLLATAQPYTIPVIPKLSNSLSARAG